MTAVEQIIAKIDALPPKHFRSIIGIDGLGASGKTTVAQAVALLRKDVSIIHTDEFYLPENERGKKAPANDGVSQDFDWDRLDAQVFQAAARGLLVKYQHYDWRADRWGDWIEVPAGNWIIIVGVYALQSRFFPYLDYSIWVDIPREERIRRMTEREGEAVSELWQQKWLPIEERYLEIDHPDKRASIVLNFESK